LHEFVQVVRELQYSKSGVTVKTEDGCVYEANYVILSVSIGVLQSDLLAFNPPLPVRLLFILLLSFPFCLHSHETRVIKHSNIKLKMFFTAFGVFLMNKTIL